MVLNANGTTFMWNVPGTTDRTKPANGPDILLYDKEEKTCLLINIAIPDDSKLTQKKLKN